MILKTVSSEGGEGIGKEWEGGRTRGEDRQEARRKDLEEGKGLRGEEGPGKWGWGGAEVLRTGLGKRGEGAGEKGQQREVEVQRKKPAISDESQIFLPPPPL